MVGGAVAVAAVLIGVALVGAAALGGHCSMAGGTCPREPGPLADDSFRMAALGAAIAVGVPFAIFWRGRHRWLVAPVMALGAGLLVAALVRSSNAG